MKVLIATHNPSKYKRYVSLLSDIPDLRLVSLSDLHITEKLSEPHNSANENAIHKAKEYARLSGLPTLAIDESATTNFLPAGKQPGVYIRRHYGTDHEMTDKEALLHWKDIFTKNPQKDKTFTWTYVQALFDPVSEKLNTEVITTVSRVSNAISSTVIPGYPMSSFLILQGTDKPHSELSEAERIRTDQLIFSKFVESFKSWIQ